MKRFLSLSLVIVFAVIGHSPATNIRGGTGSANEGIIITNADAQVNLSVTDATELRPLIANVPSRFQIWYANTIKYYEMKPFDNDLQTLINNIQPRFILHYANENRFYGFTYPKGMMGDLTPPTITEITVTTFITNSARLRWFTNEFASTQFDYGNAPLSYTQAISEPLFYKLHEVWLTDLTEGARYYYRIQHTDRSGNVSSEVASREFNFVYTIDTTPPQISDVSVTSYVTNSTHIRWTTNESATTVLDVGVQAGVYTRTLTDTMFVTAHSVWLNGLTNGTNYFYRVQGSDQSGNAAQPSSGSFRFVILKFVYLPLVRRN